MNLTEFWKRVEKAGCWTWKGASARGMGRVLYEGILWTPPELAWMAVRGTLPPNETPVPSCGTDHCCRPDHMTLAPRLILKRQLHTGQPGGARHPRARLTSEQVQEVRLRVAAGEPQKLVGAFFGISQPHVSRLSRGVRWGSLEGPLASSSKRGGQKPNAKLKETDIPIIRQRVSEGDSFAEVAHDYKVSSTTISRVWHGLSWKHVPEKTLEQKPTRSKAWE